MKHFKAIIFDTLQIDNKWSRTSLTMFSAWILSIYMALFDMYKRGFNFEVFITFVSVALGVKLFNSIGKKIETSKNKENEQD